MLIIVKQKVLEETKRETNTLLANSDDTLGHHTPTIFILVFNEMDCT